MSRRVLVVVACWAVALVSPLAMAGESKDADMGAIAQAVAPCFARVFIYPQYSEGKGPGEGAFSFMRSGFSGSFFGGIGVDSVSTALTEERPLRRSGMLVAADRVLIQDLAVHPRFINRIEVEVAGKRHGAEVDAWLLHGGGLFLKLDAPVEEVRPLNFDAQAAGPYYQVDAYARGTHWATTVTPLPEGLERDETGRTERRASPGALITNAAGVPVGVSTEAELPVDDSWKGSPLAQDALSRADVKTLEAELTKKLDGGVFLVSLRFRAPAKEEEGGFPGPQRIVRYGPWGGEEEEARERWAPGLLVSSELLLVPVSVSRDALARLETISVTGAGGQAEAEFAGAVEDYDLLLAKLRAPAAGAQPLEFSPLDLNEMLHEFVLAADLDFAQGTRTVYLQHDRVMGWQEGRRGVTHPRMGLGEPSVFCFDREGRLLGVPLVPRSKARDEEEYCYGGPYGTSVVFTSAQAQAFASHPDQFVDASLKPVSEREAKRLVWLGVELQPLNEQLAQLHKVSSQTEGGKSGAVVTHVYEGSPAERLGLQPGDVLTRLEAAGLPAPVRIRVEEYEMPEYPWTRMPDIQVPAEYFEYLPAPWPPTRNTFTQLLTEIGAGKHVTLHFVREGEEKVLELPLELGPEDYGSAEPGKFEALGATIKPVTYEVRRFYQLKKEDPGVILSKIEPGGKAAVSQLRPYELITHVGGQPVRDLETFRAALAPGGELELTVTYLGKTRLVKIKLPPAKGPQGPGETPQAQ